MEVKKTEIFIDAVEGDICRVHTGEGNCPVFLPLSLLPEGTREGDWISASFEKLPCLRESECGEISKILDNFGDAI